MKLYTIKTKHVPDQKAKGYHFHIVDRRDGEVFVSPIKRDGTCPTLGTVARLCRWIPTDHLEEVLPNA